MPADELAEGTYRVVRDVLRPRKKIGLGQMTMRGKEYLCARYADITGDGRLRHAVFLGQRQDKPAAEVGIEGPVEGVRMSREEDRPKVAGIGISSPGRVVFPGKGITKLEVAEYYRTVAERLLTTAARRPLSLVRLPEGLEGERFFQKHAGRGFPPQVRSVPIEESDGAAADYIYVRDAAGLVGAAQMGTVEFHVWGSRIDRLEQPDRLVFDLDPDEGLGFARVREAALDIRDRLAALGLPSWPLLTGGKGIHVVVPLRRSARWPAVALFARAFATHCADDAPDRYTANIRKARRAGRLFIDWLRNERGATAIAPFSLRAKPGAPVAVPVRWDELPGIRAADAFDLHSAPQRDWEGPDIPAPVALTASIAERLEALARS